MNAQALKLQEISRIRNLYAEVGRDLRTKEIYQWDIFYPNLFIIVADLLLGHLFGIKWQYEIVGAIVLDQRESSQYKPLPWGDLSAKAKPLCIHRLAVLPSYQGRGLGKQLLLFAEDYAQKGEYTSIRLDVFTGNPSVVSLYQKMEYKPVGEIHYPMRKLPYLVMEKKILVDCDKL